MKRNTIFRRALAALAIVGLLAGTAVAASTITTKTITAQYMGIQLVVDGVAVVPKDANGKVVDPFVSEGTTYLPVRAIGEALGKKVTWDGKTRTVYIGQVPGTEESWMTKLPPYQVNKDSLVYDGTDPKASFTVGGETKTTGIVLFDAVQKLSNTTDDAASAFALWNPNGLYKTMTFTIAHSTNKINSRYATNSGTLDIYLDGELWNSYDLKWDAGPQTITVPLSYALNVKLNLAGQVSGSLTYDDYTEFSIYDITFEE